MISGELISVIIPNYNNENFLHACMDSVLSQDYLDIEVVVVDDLSTDDSRKILNNYMASDGRVKVIFKTANEGVGQAREDGISYSSGNYIVTLDSDDVYLCKQKLSDEYRILKKNEQLSDRQVVAFSQIELLRENGESIGVPNRNIAEGDILDGLLSRSIMIPRDFLFKKSCYFDVGGFNQKISLYEDWDFKIRLAKKADFYFSGNKGVGYRQHAGGLSKMSTQRHIYWLLYIFCRNFSIDYGHTYIKALVPFLKKCFFIAYNRVSRKFKSV